MRGINDRKSYVFLSRTLRVFTFTAAVIPQIAVAATQDFEAVTPTGNTTSSLIIGGVTYSSNGIAQVDVVDAATQYGETFADFTGNVLANDVAKSADVSISYFEISSVDLANDFKLVSLAANAQDAAGGFASGYTITGYQGGAGGTVAVEVTGFDFATSGTYGTGDAAVSYTENSAAFNGGTLVFGAAWDHIDTVRFTAIAGSASLAFDTIAFAAPTPPPPPPPPLAPSVSSAAYDSSTNVLDVTGANITAGGTIDVSKLTITGQGGYSYTLTSANVVAIDSTHFAVTLNAVDQLNVEGLLDLVGTNSNNGTTYNLALAAGWDVTASAPVDDVNAITVNNVQKPAIASATYDNSNGLLTITAANLVNRPAAALDIKASAFTVKGEGGATYKLTSTPDVEVDSTTSFALTLSAADAVAVEVLLNKNGTSSVDGTFYNLAAADDWNGPISGGDISDANSSITVSGAAVAPTISDAKFDWAAGQLTINGSGFVAFAGNDVDVSLLTISGEGGSYTLSDSADVEIANATRVVVNLGPNDELNVRGVLNRNGSQSGGGAGYNLAAADNWLRGAPGALDISDLSGNAINVGTVGSPSITSATYDASAGLVSVSGNNFFKKLGANNDVVLSTLTFTGGNNQSYTLSTLSGAEIGSANTFIVVLSGTDKTNVDALLDVLGTKSSSGTTYNLAAADGWLAAADTAGNIADRTNPITVAINPEILSATYNGANGTLTVKAKNLWTTSGAAKEIDASKFTIFGANGGAYTLSSQTADVKADSGTQFTLTLAATDKAQVDPLLNNIGTRSADNNVYNLAAANGWNIGAGSGDISDLVDNAILVVNSPPVVSNLNGNSVNFAVGGNAVTLDAGNNVTVADPNSPNFDGGYVTASIVANNQPAEDILRVGTVGAISVSGSDVLNNGTTIGTVSGGTGGTALTIILNADATPATVQNLLRALQYFDSDTATLNTANRTVRVTIDDGDAGNSTSTDQNVTVRIVRAPTVDLDVDNSSGASGGDYHGQFIQGGGAVRIADLDTAITDDNNAGTLVVSLVNHPDGGSEWVNTNYPGKTIGGETITVTPYKNGVMTIDVGGKGAKLADMQTLIESIRYNNNSGTPNVTTRLINVVVIDTQGNAGLPAVASIAMSAVNQTPNGYVTVTGVAMENHLLTADTSKLSDPNGLGALSYQWQRNGTPVAGATSNTYMLTRGDVGAVMNVVVSYTDNAGNAESVASAATAPIDGDLDGDGTADNVDSDIDGDGMSNLYEDANGLNKLDASDRNTDRDGDGVSNYNEFIAGTRANADDYPPVITPPADVTVNATSLFTAVDIGQASAIDGHDGTVRATVAIVDGHVPTDGVSHFRAGHHTLVWVATDAAGYTATARQNVNVVPLVDCSKSQSSAEGAVATFKVMLNGPAVTYPVTVPYTVSGTASTDGSDHDLVSGVVTIDSPNVDATVTVNLVNDGPGEGTETVVFTMGTPTNAVPGAMASHTIEIHEDNVAPTVDLQATQNGKNTHMVAVGGGSVVVTAAVTDPNSADSHSYDWSGSNNALVDRDNVTSTFTFDPTGLTPGLYTLKLAVNDGTTQGQAELDINVVATLPSLTTADSDGDGFTDKDEGVADGDGDGVPNYLDHSELALNVLQEKANSGASYLIETEAGLALRLGRTAFQTGRGVATVTSDDVTRYGDAAGVRPDNGGYGYEGGLFDFDVAQLPSVGQTVKVVIPQLAAIPDAASYRLSLRTGWQAFTENTNNQLASAPGAAGYCPPAGSKAYTAGLTAGHWCVQLTVQDGGPNDADGLANGVVRDPGGVTGPLVSAPPPTTKPPVNVGISGSGGGAISLWSLLLLGVITVVRRAARVRGVLLATLGAIAACATAQADTDVPYYVGANYLWVKSDERSSDFQNDLSNLGLDATVTQSHLARSGWATFAGYEMDEKVAFELSYVDLGDVTTNIEGTADNVDAYLTTASAVHPTTASGWSGELVLRKPVTRTLDVIGKFGVFLWRADYTMASATASKTFSDSGTGGVFNVSFETDYIPWLPLHIGGNLFFFSEMTVSAMEIGATYRF